MAEFSANFQSFKPSFPCLDIDPIPNIDYSNQFTGLNSSHVLDNTNIDYQSFMGFSSDASLFSHQTAEFPGNFSDNFPGVFHQNDQKPVPVMAPVVLPADQSHETKKRKAMEVSESSSGYSPSPAASQKSGTKRKNNTSRGKRVKSNEKEDEKPKEVVHVRARRGQATDSHSLAERVRRGKINERLRCLQDIVPGCYKTMGMAVMLDEIINYVQSLQNQVEFLSMKLTAASTLHDLNSEAAALQTLQMAKAEELQELERLMRESYGGPTCFAPTWPL